jgi:DNA invertase Pin-like site-specific DNA recombinase
MSHVVKRSASQAIKSCPSRRVCPCLCVSLAAFPAGREAASGALRVAIYSRVSTDHQTTENQERELQAIAERIGWTVVKVYRDQGVSGAKSRQDRPAFDALCKDASRRQFDLIAAWSVDRLGRSLQDLVGFLTEIHALGVNLFLHQQGVDTTTPAGKALFQMMGVFAEFERAMIQERVKAGLQRAKAQGKVLGRPSTQLEKVEAIKAGLRAGSVGIIKLAKLHGVGVGTVQRIKAALTA